MEEDLRALLLASSGVTALVGTRINWGEHPQGQPLPGLVLNVISDPGDHTLDGPTGDGRARVQADVWALTYAQAVAGGRAVRAALDGHSGGRFRAILFADRRTTRNTGGADEPYRDSLDFFVHTHNH